MQITEVTYRELRSGPGYNHLAIEVKATVEPDEPPELALERAKWWVRNQHFEHQQHDRDVVTLQGTKRALEYEVKRLTAERNRRIEAMRLITRWRVWRAEMRHWWQKRVLRRDFSDRELDDVPF
jgi:hypothetical protein